MQFRYLEDGVKIVLLALVYIATARFGLSLGAVAGVATAVWAPTGISLAVLLIWGYRLWPGISVGALLSNLSVGVPFLAALGISLGNTLEAVLGVYLLTRFAKFHPSMERVKDILALLFFAATLSTLVSATIGTASAWLGGVIPSNHFVTAWWTWWVGNSMGDLIIAPVIFTWSVRYPLSSRRILEAIFLLLVLGFVSEIVFGGFFFFERIPYPLTFLVFPIFIWAALRFRPRLVSIAVFEVAAIAIWNTLHQSIPFARGDLTENLLVLQIFMGVLAMTSFVLAATVTQSRRAEEALSEKAVELERSNKELVQFAAVVSHDLQEPLLKIIAFGDRLKATSLSALGEKGADYLDRMQKAAYRMRQLIDDLLTLSRVTKTKKPLVPVSLETVLKKVLSEMEIRIKESKASVEVKPLPILMGDEMQLHQVFQNLISNALRYRKKDEAPQILIKSQDLNNGFTEIIVEDHGIGFDEEYRERIFEPFERLDPEIANEGTGMGLAICKKIAERHGGDITAKSRPGVGSTFIITLPLSEP